MLQPRPESHSAHSADSAPGLGPGAGRVDLHHPFQNQSPWVRDGEPICPRCHCPSRQSGHGQPRGDPMTTPAPRPPGLPRTRPDPYRLELRQTTGAGPLPRRVHTRSATHRATPPCPAAPLSMRLRRGGRHDRAADRPCFFDKRIRVTRQSSFLHTCIWGGPQWASFGAVRPGEPGRRPLTVSQAAKRRQPP